MASIGTVEGYLKLTDDFTTVLDRAMGALQKSTGMMKTNLEQMQAALDMTGEAAKQMGAAVEEAGDDVEVGAKKAKASTSMLHDLRAAYALAAVGIWQFIDRTVAAQQASDRMRNSLLAGTGDIKIVGQELAFIREESNRLGLDLAAAGVQYGKLTAASKGTGIAMKDVRATFTAVAEAATALGLSSEDTTGALNAVVQMMTKGTVQAEELRGQLGDRVPGAVQAMARALGVGNEEMMKMLEQGKVITADVLPRFAEELAKIGGSGVEAGMQSLNAELNRLETSLFDLFTGIAGDVSLTNFVKTMREFVAVVDDLLRNGGGAAIFENLSIVIKDALGSIGLLLTAYDKLSQLADKIVGAGGSGLSASDFTPAGYAAGLLDQLGAQIEQSKAEVTEWSSAFKEGMSVAGSSVFSVVGAFQQGASAADKFFMEMAASERALTSDDLVAQAQKENKKNLTEMQATLERLTKSSIEYGKANAAAFDLEDKLKNQAQELAVFQKLLKETGGNYVLAKKNAASYYAVLKAGLNPLKGWGKQLYEMAANNDVLDASFERGKKAAADFERNVEKLDKSFRKGVVAASKDAAQAVTKFGKEISEVMGQMGKFNAEVDNYWGAWEAASQGADALQEFNKEAEIQAEIQSRLGVRLTSNAVLYDRYAAEIRESLGAIIDHRNAVQNTIDMYEGMADVLNTTDWGSDKMNDLASGLGQVMSAMGKLSTATKLFSKETAQAWAGMLNGINAVLEATGAFQAGNGGGFGGTSEGNYAAEGQMVGAIIGGIIGAFVGAPQAGMAIGAAAGGMLGGFIKKGAEEALATVYIKTDGFSNVLRKAEGDLGGSISQLGTSIGTSILDIVASIGGQIASLPAVEMKIRDGVIGVVIGGVKAKFKEMDDAISFAVAELLKQGDILGIDAMLRDALQNTSASSLEGLSRDLDAVMKVLSYGMTESQKTIQAFTNELDGLRGQMMRLLTDSGQLARAMSNLAAEEARRWQSSRDAITGEKRTNAEKLAMLRQDAEMWNAEKAIRIADLRLQALEVQRKIDLFKTDIELFRAGGKLFNAKYEMDRARLIAERDLMSGQRDLYQQDLDARSAYIEAQAVLLQVQLDAINQLVGVLVAIPDINIPSLHLPNVGGGAGSGAGVNSGPSEREQREIAFLEFLDGYRLSSLSDVMQSLDELETAFAEQAQAASEVENGEALLAAARRQALAEIREDVIDAFGSPMEGLRDRIAEIRQQVADWFAINNELGEQFLAGEISLQQLLDALAEANVLWAEFGDMARQELLGLASYFTDAMGNTEESARIREELAEMEWDFNRLQMQMLIETWAELGILSQAAADHWRDFIATLPENRPGNVNDSTSGAGGGSLQAAIARLRSAIEALRKSNENLLLSDVSPLSTADQFAEAERIYNETLAAAQGGDLQAIEDFASVRDQYLELAAAMYGTAGAGYESIFQQSLQAGQDLAAAGQAILDAIPPQMSGVEDRLDTIAEILAAIAAAQLPADNPHDPPGGGPVNPDPNGGNPPRPPRPPGGPYHPEDDPIWGDVGGDHPYPPGPMGGGHPAMNASGAGGNNEAVGQLRALNANMLLLMQAVETQARETRNLSMMRTPATLPGGRRR